MMERDWSDRFSRDVDHLLDEVGPADAEPLPVEYQEALDLARTLATTDFSAESQIRHTLRYRLLNQVGAPERQPRRGKSAVGTFSWGRRRLATLATMMLVVLLCVVAVWPNAPTALLGGVRGPVSGEVELHTAVMSKEMDRQPVGQRDDRRLPQETRAFLLPDSYSKDLTWQTDGWFLMTPDTSRGLVYPCVVDSVEGVAWADSWSAEASFGYARDSVSESRFCDSDVDRPAGVTSLYMVSGRFPSTGIEPLSLGRVRERLTIPVLGGGPYLPLILRRE